jgi:hypothetical protein
VIFSIILASNFAVYSASSGRAQLYSQSDAEDSLTDSSAAMAGAAAANVLAEVQAEFAATSFICQHAAQTASAIVVEATDVQRSPDLTVLATASPAPDTTSSDNLSIIRPFEGSVEGDLNILVKVSESGGATSEGVVLQKTEAHLAHLPVRFPVATDDCLAAVDDISTAAASSGHLNCTRDVLSPIIWGSIKALAVEAYGQGLVMGLSFTITDATNCKVAYSVSIVQGDVFGPAGSFSLRLAQEGDASF